MLLLLSNRGDTPHLEETTGILSPGSPECEISHLSLKRKPSGLFIHMATKDSLLRLVRRCIYYLRLYRHHSSFFFPLAFSVHGFPVQRSDLMKSISAPLQALKTRQAETADTTRSYQSPKKRCVRRKVRSAQTPTPSPRHPHNPLPHSDANVGFVFTPFKFSRTQGDTL